MKKRPGRFQLDRQFFVLAHRWVGLAMALFIVLAGLTGSALAFREELEAWLAPGLHRAAPRCRKWLSNMASPSTPKSACC
jgi:uncharacterized iron-regulated membrane protein